MVLRMLVNIMSVLYLQLQSLVICVWLVLLGAWELVTHHQVVYLAFGNCQGKQ